MNVNEDLLRATFDRYEEHMPVDGDLADSVRARVRTDRRKRWATLGGVAVALLLAGGAWIAETQTSTSGDVASDAEPPGRAVGERLGLEPVPFPGEGCKQWVGYEHDWGYCLDGVTNDETDLVLLSQEIMGYEMSDARIAYVSAIIEYGDYAGQDATKDDPAREAELKQIINETKPQLEPLYEPTDVATFAGLSGEQLADAANLVPTHGVPHVGGSTVPSSAVDIGGMLYVLDGLATTQQDAEEWASAIWERNVRTAVMPDVEGLTEGEAVAALEAAGFTVDIERTYSSEVDSGHVITQVYPAGQDTLLVQGQTILVSKGPIPTEPPASAPVHTMPSLVGLTTREAEHLIRQLDLYGPFQKSTVPGNPTTVVRQEPAAGTDVYGATDDFPGTIVRIWIG